MMNSPYLKSKFQTIDSALSTARDSKARDSIEDPQIDLMLGGYFVVLISGIYEESVEYLFTERAGKHGDSELKNFVSKLVGDQFRNPEYGKITKLLGYLDKKYVQHFEKEIGVSEQSALESIVNNKNALAHGKDCGATLKDVSSYYERSVKIFEVLEKILL